MKKAAAVLIILSMIIFPVSPAGAENGTESLEKLVGAASLVFDGSGEGFDKTPLSEAWGWAAQYDDGMCVTTDGGINYLRFYKSDEFKEGGNLVLDENIAKATSGERSDFAILEFTVNSQDVSGEHIYTLYGAPSNVAGKEILKFKYKNGIMPCTSSGQNEDKYTSSPISQNGDRVRIFFLRGGGKLSRIYQVNSGGWKTAYEGEGNLSAFEDGFTTLRAFVKFGTAGAATGFGNLKIYAGRFSDAENPARFMERLDRGLAVMKTDGGIYLSWRLLGTENYDAAFDVYRNGKKIASVSDSTNYVDLSGAASDFYSVAPSGGERCGEASAFSSGENYFDIPLSKPKNALLPDGTEAEYTPWDASVGDCDGDGEYEIIQRWDSPRRHAGSSGYTGGMILDAYKLDGTLLWRIDLGVNIRCNTENVFSVYDYNGDGVAEIAAKTAPGSRDGTGRFVTEASLVEAIRNADNSIDFRGESGAVLEGEEYYTLFDGRNGKALDTIYYPIPRGEGSEFYVWGDKYGHRSEKYFDLPAYLDGVHPYIVLWRGIYAGQSGVGKGRTAAAALKVDKNSRMSVEYRFDTLKGQSGYSEGNEKYIGQGNHNISVGDVDGDGLDEIVSGNLCLDGDLSVLWCSRRGHGDAQHLGNYDPTTKNLEYMTVHENSPYGMTVYNAATGEELLHIDGSGDTGRGVMANVGSGGYYQVWGAGVYQNNGGSDFSETNLSGQSYNFRIFWDGDTYDELLDAANSTSNHTPVITSYNASSGAMEEIFRCYDTETINTTKSTPALTADILGDWREEVIAVSEDLSALRVFVSPIYTKNKLYTLMHDSQYRQSVAWQNEYYNQPPHIGFYLSGDNDEYDERSVKPNIVTIGYIPTDFEESIHIESGTLKEKKVPDEKNLLDMDGDYFHAYDYICTTGTQNNAGSTKIALSSKRYAYAASANPHHASVLLSGVERKDGRFVAFAANGDSQAKLTVFADGGAAKGKLHLDFAIPSNFSNNGSTARGGDDVSIFAGSEILLSYSWEEKALSLNGSEVYRYADEYEAQKWTSLDVDFGGGKARIVLTFPSAEVCEETLAATYLPIGSVAFETSGWGSVLFDNLTLFAPYTEEIWLSTEGFEARPFTALGEDFAFDMDFIAFEKTDGVIGFFGQDASPDWYDKLNLALRITSEGLVEAYNGSGYAAVNKIAYEPNEKYHLRIEGSVRTKKYSAYVTDGSGNTSLLAKDYSFRAGAPDTDNLGGIVVCGGDGAGGGRFAVKNFVFYPVICSDRVDNAVLSGGTLTIFAEGEMTVFVLTYDADGNFTGVHRADILNERETKVKLDKECAYAELYIWESGGSCKPLSQARNAM